MMWTQKLRKKDDERYTELKQARSASYPSIWSEYDAAIGDYAICRSAASSACLAARQSSSAFLKVGGLTSK
jgi:hypothetical protein